METEDKLRRFLLQYMLGKSEDGNLPEIKFWPDGVLLSLMLKYVSQKRNFPTMLECSTCSHLTAPWHRENTCLVDPCHVATRWQSGTTARLNQISACSVVTTLWTGSHSKTVSEYWLMLISMDTVLGVGLGWQCSGLCQKSGLDSWCRIDINVLLPRSRKQDW